MPCPSCNAPTDDLCQDCVDNGLVECDGCKMWKETVDCDGTPLCEGCADTQGYRQCADCNDWHNDGGEHAEGNYYCQSCIESAGYMTCEGCDGYHDSDNMTDCDGKWYCEDCRDRHGYVFCHACGCVTNEAKSGADDNDYCSDCWGDRFTECQGCNSVVSTDDVYWNGDGNAYCESCHDSRCGGDYDPLSFNPTANTFEAIDPRCFGVEIETDQCDNHTDYRGCFGAKPDGSINGKEFYSTILSGDAGLAEVSKLCNFADRNGWAVDDSCGLHAHFDMRGESVETLKAIAYAMLSTYDVFGQFVAEGRLRNHYCKPCRAGAGELYGVSNFGQWCQRQTRYEWFNYTAYVYHKTFEVRLHHGSIDGWEICNWIRGISLWMAWAKRKGWKGVTTALIALDTDGKYTLMRKVWQEAGCDDLVTWFDEKISVLV